MKGFEIMIILDELRVEMTGYRKEMTELADVLNINSRLIGDNHIFLQTFALA